MKIEYDPVERIMAVRFDSVLELKIELARFERKYKDVEVQKVEMKKTIVCDSCYGEVTPSSGKYLCLSGCGHVEGLVK